jgi:hypothetical protein
MKLLNCSTSHPLEENTTMKECLNLQNDGINVQIVMVTTWKIQISM